MKIPAQSESVSAPRKPTRKEIDLYYKTHRSQFQSPERVHVLQIIKNIEHPGERKSALVSLERARARLLAGESFARVADEESDCRGNGGDLGWITRGVMVDEFDDVVFELPLGQDSAIFETCFGFHIARVMEKRPRGIQPLSEVYQAISSYLQNARGEVGGR